MGFNRLVDRHIDARNPRTAARELPAGKSCRRATRCGWSCSLQRRLRSAGAFAAEPALRAGSRSPVLVVLLGYSLVQALQRASRTLVLGLALGLAPLGAWVAVRGEVSSDLAAVLLARWPACWTWVAGFDLIYACQDVDFDRDARACTPMPARLGVAGALRLSSLLHVRRAGRLLRRARAGSARTSASILRCGDAGRRRRRCWCGSTAIVSADDLSRVDVAFFTLNGWVGIGLFLGRRSSTWRLALSAAARRREIPAPAR